MPRHTHRQDCLDRPSPLRSHTSCLSCRAFTARKGQRSSCFAWTVARSATQTIPIAHGCRPGAIPTAHPFPLGMKPECTTRFAAPVTEVQEERARLRRLWHSVSRSQHSRRRRWHRHMLPGMSAPRCARARALPSLIDSANWLAGFGSADSLRQRSTPRRTLLGPCTSAPVAAPLAHLLPIMPSLYRPQGAERLATHAPFRPKAYILRVWPLYHAAKARNWAADNLQFGKIALHIPKNRGAAGARAS